MHGRFTVDVDGVGVFAERIRNIGGELDANRVSFSYTDFGDGRILESLERFHGDWSQKRSSLVETLRNAGDALANVVQQVAELDSELRRALGEGGAGGAGGGSLVHAQPATLRTHGRALGSAAITAQSRMTALRFRLLTISAGFEGQAADAFGLRMQEVVDNHGGLVDSLKALGEFLEAAATAIADTDAALAEGLRT